MILINSNLERLGLRVSFSGSNRSQLRTYEIGVASVDVLAIKLHGAQTLLCDVVLNDSIQVGLVEKIGGGSASN